MHRLLTQQLKKLGLKSSHTPDLKLWASMLEQIDASYKASDQDRYTLERSLTISSEEMQALYTRQKISLEKRLQSIINALPDVLFLVTEDGKCIEVISGNKELLEKNRKMALGNYLHDSYPKEKADMFKHAVNKALDEKQLVVIHYDLKINDRQHYFEGRIMPSNYDYKGKRTVVFVAIDTTKRVKAEIQGKLLAKAFEKSKDGMLILDHNFNVITVNQAFCDLNGKTMESINESIQKVINDYTDTDEADEIRASIAEEGHWMGEITGHDNNGDPFPLWLTINSVKDDNDLFHNYAVMLTDVSEIKQSQEELVHVATHDSLTNLPNRILFNDRLEQAVHRAERNNLGGALFFLDLDRFKNVNDNLGHQIGDELLVQVTQRLLEVSRSADTLARLGGDEFTLIIEGVVNADELSSIANKILNALAPPFELGGYNLDISASIGISVFPRDSIDPVELVKHADTAMYSAKDLGRNTYQFYTQELTTNAFEYFAIEVALRKALELNQFFLQYQPQYDLKTNKLIGVEALIRWQHPDMGIVSPGRFIPIAETTGQIEAIGKWVITESCRQCSLWRKQGLPYMVVSINLSRKQLVVPTLYSEVSKILHEEEVLGEQLEFEITESAILDNEDIVFKNLKQFKMMGISMAIDDFGTGYSSLVNLKQFPLSRLKIDQSFVRDVTKDKNDEAIIKATIALGKSLELKIIAEGVEKEEQRDFLIREGCDQVQGFLFSEPLLPEEITKLFNTKDMSVN
ncbi:MAG: EAL domain-containing protein [Proteobacteria bacterium]|nr:EAL domain-containing protein [Pseudomonadota bacterium]